MARPVWPVTGLLAVLARAGRPGAGDGADVGGAALWPSLHAPCDVGADVAPVHLAGDLCRISLGLAIGPCSGLRGGQFPWDGWLNGRLI
jgi:hypothetical protein